MFQILTEIIDDAWFNILNQMSLKKSVMEKKWWMYLRPFHRILVYFETYQNFYHANGIRGCKVKLFSLLPIRQFVPRNVLISTIELREIINRWFGVNDQEGSPWVHFNVGLVNG